jgi:ribose transport system substrate-binding protein
VKTAIRPIVWFAVIAAAVAVGWYVKEAPKDVVNPKPATSGNYLFLAGGSDPYWELCMAGALASAKESGANLKVLKPTGEGEEGLKEQLEWLTSIEANQFDGLAIGPIDPARQTTLINAAAEKFPVVTVDSDAPESRRMFYIGSSNYEAGMIAAKMVKEALPEGGKVAVLMASEAKTNAAERKQGLVEVLARVSDSSDDPSEVDSPSYEIVGFYLDQGDFDLCHKNVVKACAEHGDLAAVVCTFGYHGPIALEALQEAGRQPAIQLIAFDEDQRTLAAVEDGRIYATIVQDPFMFGAEAVQMLEKVRNGKFLSLPVSNGAVGVHCKAITKNNLAKFRTQLSTRLEANKSSE